MCGIAGFAIHDADVPYIDVAKLVSALMLGIEHRGKDATGIATVGRTGRVRVVKEPVTATAFLRRHDRIGSGARMALIHTRAMTQGSQHVPGNNHPIEYGNVVGIHNGMISNDADVFSITGWERHAQVDSEAIFAALHHKDDRADALEAVDGSYAVAWIDRDDPHRLHIARGWGSPLCYATTKAGSVIFASTAEVVADALLAIGFSSLTPEATAKQYVTTVEQGRAYAWTHDGGLGDEITFDHTGRNAIEDPTMYRYTSWSRSSSVIGSESPVNPYDRLVPVMVGDVVSVSVIGVGKVYAEVIGVDESSGELWLDMGQVIVPRGAATLTSCAGVSD